MPKLVFTLTRNSTRELKYDIQQNFDKIQEKNRN